MSQEFRIEIPQIDPRWSRSLVPLVAIIVAGLALLSSSVYSVGTESVGVIQRLESTPAQSTQAFASNCLLELTESRFCQ